MGLSEVNDAQKDEPMDHDMLTEINLYKFFWPVKLRVIGLQNYTKT